MSWKEEEKKRAALESAKLVKTGQVVGLGTGSTIYYVVEELGRRVREEGLKIIGIPTSNQTEAQAKGCGIALTTLDEHPQIDIAIDGADQVDPNLNLIKGMGGALTREKIVDSAAKYFVIVVDESKMSNKLGINQPIPIEVIPMALTPVMNKIKSLGGNPIVRQPTKTNSKYFVTDNGNFVIDADFGEIKNPEKLEIDLKMIPGVVENGLFINMTHKVYVGEKTSVKVIDKETKS
ncbi:MAG: ribose 5-phosphate isomerase [Thermoproteota archaeon]|nr:ribose 5-phosphate isomerase [Thermoproteota archaeon]